MSRIERLATTGDLDQLLSAAGESSVWLFKHSLTCPVSAEGLREFESYVATVDEGDPLRFALIEVQPARVVSNEVAERYGVRHESPQALLVEDGEVVWHASHWQITSSSLTAAVAGERPAQR